jgi:hypothetical protein
MAGRISRVKSSRPRVLAVPCPRLPSIRGRLCPDFPLRLQGRARIETLSSHAGDGLLSPSAVGLTLLCPDFGQAIVAVVLSTSP